MTGWLSSLAQILVVVIILAVAYAPLGDHMARVFTRTGHSRVERGLYRALRIDPDANQRPFVYLISLLAFSLVSILLLLTLLIWQDLLPFGGDVPQMSFPQALNTAVSFVTNTNWQSYSGESALGIGTQALGLTVQNFVSAAVGLTVVIALIRGFLSRGTGRLGNFWVDLTRGTLRILLPIALLGAVAMLLLGAVQNLNSPVTVTTVAGGSQTLPGGLVASQEAIKQLGTNGGGYFNANSAHPFENPSAVSNLLQITLMLLIPAALPRTLGRMVGDLRQGRAVGIAMAVLWTAALTVALAAEYTGTGVAGGMEGKETRFGVSASTLFAVSTTATSTGATDSLHSSYSGGSGGVFLLNMMLGEISPGGVGAGLYGMLIMAVVTVFLAGLMIGRTPTLLGKRISASEMTVTGAYLIVTPALILLGAGSALALSGPRESILNPGSHGLTEVVYAYTSAANNNGSAFAGLNANTDHYNLTLALVMLIGRFAGIALVIALAGRLSRQHPVPADSGTLPTRGLQFITLLVVVTLLVAGLTYVPTLVLGPLAEGLS